MHRAMVRGMAAVGLMGVGAALSPVGQGIASSLVTSAQIKNHTIQLQDMSTATKASLRRPAPINVESSDEVPFGDETVVTAIAYCPSGYRALSGGGASVSDGGMVASVPLPDRTGWGVIGVDVIADDPGQASYVQAVAECERQEGVFATSHSDAAAYMASIASKMAVAHRVK